VGVEGEYGLRWISKLRGHALNESVQTAGEKNESLIYLESWHMQPNVWHQWLSLAERQHLV
jgi:hypothetical protein